MACPGFRPAEINCPICGGKCFVSNEQAGWIAEGDKMRKDRIVRNVGIREEAKRRGMSPLTLSQMEQGVVKPVRE